MPAPADGAKSSVAGSATSEAVATAHSKSISTNAATCKQLVRHVRGTVRLSPRITERIDGTIIANWKLHHLINQVDIESAVIQAAAMVDQQNLGASGYVPLSQGQGNSADILKDPAIVAVLQIIDEAAESPSAYVEPALFRNRRAVKASS